MKMIVFDLDGTLADSMPIALKAANTLRFLFGYKKLNSEDKRLRQTPGFDLVKNILKLNLLQVVVWLPMVKWLVEKDASEIQIFRGWETTLKKIKKRKSIGLLTSSREAYAQTILRQIKGVKFDAFSFGTPYHRKANALKTFLKVHGLKKTDILYVGDEIRDLKACKAIGIRFAAVTWGKDDSSIFPKPDGKIFLGFLKKPNDVLKFSK